MRTLLPQAGHRCLAQIKHPRPRSCNSKKRGRKGGGKAEDASPQIPKGAAFTGSLDRQSGPSSYSEGHGVSPRMSGEQERAICPPDRKRGGVLGMSPEERSARGLALSASYIVV